MEQLYQLLSSLNIPVAYSHFITPTSPPFITYYRTSTNNFEADNQTFEKIEIIRIELYTLSKDIELEEQLEEVLNNNEIAYQVISENYIESEKVYQVIYEINI